MKKYKVIRIMKYTEEVVVEAASCEEAEEISNGMEFERNYDDYWYDSEVYEI